MTRKAYGVLTAGFFTVFIAYAIRYGYGLLLPEMLPSLGITKTQAGIIYASYFLAYTLFSPVLGLLSDRYDMRRLLTGFTALLGAGAFFMAYATSVVGASFFFILAGIGHAACWAPVMALVQRWVPEQRRGTALGVTTLGSAVGMSVWSLVLPVIVNHFSWKAGWISMGLFSFLVAAMNFCLVQSHPEPGLKRDLHPTAHIKFNAILHTYWQLLKENNLWLIGLSYLMVGFTVLVPYTFIGTYAIETLGLPYSTAARFIATMAVSGMLGKLTLAILSDTLGRIKVMMICDLLMGLGCVGMMLVDTISGIYVACMVFGLGFGAVWPVYAAAAPDFFPKKTAGSVVGLWTVFLGLGSIVSPVLCGWTIDLTQQYAGIFLLGTASALTAVLFLVPVIPKRM